MTFKKNFKKYNFKFKNILYKKKINEKIFNLSKTKFFLDSNIILVDRYITFFLPANNISTAPPYGLVLSQYGFDTSEFCNSFNLATSSIYTGTPLKVIITLYSNKSYSYKIKTPPTSLLLYTCMYQHQSCNLSMLSLYKIASIKKIDSPFLSKFQLIKNLCGSIRSIESLRNFYFNGNSSNLKTTFEIF